MNYGTLETELVTKLNAYFVAQLVDDKFEAVEIPQNDAESQRPFVKSRVTVQYYNSTYSPSQGMSAVSQHEKIIVRLTFEARNLRGEQGFFTLVELVKRSLLGYKPNNCTTRLVIDKYDFIFYENNTASPYMDFRTETLNVQLPDPEAEDPAFKDLTIERQCP